MKFIKRYIKILIGVGVLVMAMVVFFFAQQTSDLETGTLKDWAAASLEQRTAATQIIVASSENNELLVACVDKMATLPASGEMAIRDAISLCYTGIQLQGNL